jgi:hypothetical protein
LATLGEVYSVLTGLPVRPRITGGDAIDVLRQIRDRLTLVTLAENEFVTAIEAVAATIVGGAVYDALIAHCAVKAGADVLFTWNQRDFTRFRRGWPTGKNACGIRNGKIDCDRARGFILKQKNIAVEAKMRATILDRRTSWIDWPSTSSDTRRTRTAKTLICLVYAPNGKCNNPTALENDLTTTHGDLNVIALVRPKPH